MRTDEEIRREIELLQPLANAEEISHDRECARNLIHTLTWVLNEPQFLLGKRIESPYPPHLLLGFANFHFSAEALEVIRFRKT